MDFVAWFLSGAVSTTIRHLVQIEYREIVLRIYAIQSEESLISKLLLVRFDVSGEL